MWVTVILVGGMIVAILCVYTLTKQAPLNPPAEGDSVGSSKQLLFKHTQINELRKELRKQKTSKISVADLMTDQVAKVRESTGIEQVRELMSAHRGRHLLVENDAGLLIGVISDRDIVQRRGRTAKSIMTCQPSTCSPDCHIGEALNLMLGKHISCLPVVECYQVRGVITTTDLLLALECLLESLESGWQETAETCEALAI